MIPNKFYIPVIYTIRYAGEILPPEAISLEIMKVLVNRKSCLLWGNQGIFRLIPPAVLRNVSLARTVMLGAEKQYLRTHLTEYVRGIVWDQGIPISFELAQSLLSVPCEEPENADKTDSTPQSTGEDQSN